MDYLAISPKPKEKEIEFDYLGGDDISKIPLSSVITKDLMKDQTVSPGLITHLKSGIVDDPKIKMQIYSAARFPELSAAERANRYGISNGEIVYMGDDGKLYRETPDTWMGKIKRFTGETAAHAPSIILSAGLAVLGPLGAVLGAAGGEGLRKSTAATVFGEEQTTLGNIGSMGKEAAFAYGGEKVFRGAGRAANWLGAKRGGKLAAAAGENRGTIDIAKSRRLRASGKDWGVDLGAAETTGSRRLSNDYNFLGDLEQTADKIKLDRLKKMGQIEDALENKLPKRISSKKLPTITKTTDKMVAAAEKAVQKPIKIRQQKAKPLYKKAFRETPPIKTDWVKHQLDNIFKDVLPGSGEEATYKRFSKMLQEDTITLKKFDTFKKEIDKVLDDPGVTAKHAVDKGIKAQLSNFKSRILTRLDKISPKYAKARKIFGQFSEEVDKQSVKTLVGTISKLKGDQKITAIRKLFTAHPEVVERTARQIRRTDPDSLIDATRHYIADEFQKISSLETDEITNIGGKMYKLIVGSKNKQRNLKAIAGERVSDTVKNLMEVLRTTGEIMRKESATASRSESLKEGLVGKFIRAKTRPLYTPQRIVGDILRALQSKKTLNKYADAMISEDAAKQLEKMIQLPSGSQKLLPMLGAFHGLVLAGEFTPVIGRKARRKRQKDALPPSLQPSLLMRLR